MNCMKCGREIQEEAVFCQECLAEMEKYPVQPGAVVLLPRRTEPSILKKLPKRHVPTAEEQVVFFRKWATISTILLIICMGLIALMFQPTMHYVMDEHYEIGQNYSSVVTTTPATTASGGE